MKLKEVLDKSVQFFKDKKIESARFDAELLISHALKIQRIDLYLKYDQPLAENELTLCREFIRRRSTGEPVAYILEEKGFFGIDFIVQKGVLVPRPETEILVEHALDFILKNKIQNPKILDLGAGSGCIGLSLLKNNPEANLIAVDKSSLAQEVWMKNCTKLELTERAKFILDSVENLNVDTFSNFDLILSNPPYIDIHDDRVQKSVREFEPELALFADQQGFLFLKNWSKKFCHKLNPMGLMMFELGVDQGQEMKKYFSDLGLFTKVDVVQDLAGLDRFIKGQIN